MVRRVKIKSIPQKKDGGVSYNQLAPMYIPNGMSQEPMKVRKNLTAAPRKQATIEAEGGETVLTQVGGLPAHFNISGKRHAQGGVPLNVPDESFIFSDTRAMIIKDPEILAEFGETKSKTPAAIAKKYDINKYREILADPDLDKRSKETAEQMISNYNIKLAKLAAYQESMKGFPDGIPTVALPYMMVNQIDPKDMLPLRTEETGQEEMLDDDMYEMENPSEQEFVDEETMPEAQFGMNVRRQNRLQRRLDRLRQQQQFDPTSGIYLNVDPQGRAYYVDGRGVAMPQSVSVPNDFIKPGTVMNTTTNKTTQKTVSQSKPSKAKIDESKVKKQGDPSLKAGDYFRDANGKLRQVTKIGYKNTPTRQSFSGAENYKPQYGSIEEDVKAANALLEDLDKKGFAKKTNDGWIIYAGAKDAMSLKDKDFITKVSSYNKGTGLKDLGAPGFKIASQSQYENATEANVPKGKGKKRDDGFYGFADPDMLEFRYWQATNPNGTFDDYENLDDTSKIQNRKGMLSLYGYDVKKLGDKVNDPSKLYTKEFVTDPKDGLTARNERTFKGAEGKIYRSADDAKIGLDHLDAYTIDPEMQDVEVDETEGPGEIPTNELDVTQRRERPGAEWWLQDAIATAGAFGDLMRVKKYMPWTPKLAPYIPEPTFYDPTRELAAISEQANIATQGAGAYAPAQAYNARASQIQGNAAKATADTLGRYNNINVGAANQFELTKANIFNQTGMANAASAQDYYDKTIIANQQFDNANAQARQGIRESLINAITNRAQGQALNEVYGNHYMTDPSSGGFVEFTGGDELNPSNPYSQQKADAFALLRNRFPEEDDETLLKLMSDNTQSNYADDYMKSLASMYPVQTGAGYGGYYDQG
jgi:hypothetical protein